MHRMRGQLEPNVCCSIIWERKNRGMFVRHDVSGANVTVWLALPWQIHYCDGAP